MSRVKIDPVKDGQVVDAADLNARFDAFTQTDLNAFNHRNAAYDLPQFSGTPFYGLFGQKDDLGKEDFFHAAPVGNAGIATLPAAGYVIGDGAAQTIASFPLGLSVTTEDVLRIYWNLSVGPFYSSKPWVRAGSLANYAVAHTLGGTQLVSTNASCWVFYLEWDITSAALANWTPVAYQGDFTTVVGATGYVGEALAGTTATTVCPCWITYHVAADRLLVQDEHDRQVGWRGISGCYYYDTSMAGPVTIYGLRLKLKGPMHPYNDGGVNYLVHDLAAMNAGLNNVIMYHTSGRMNTFLHRKG